MFSLTPTIFPQTQAGHLDFSYFCTGFSWHECDVKRTYSLYDHQKEVLLTGLGVLLTEYEKVATTHEWKQTSCGRSCANCVPSPARFQNTSALIFIHETTLAFAITMSRKTTTHFETNLHQAPFCLNRVRANASSVFDLAFRMVDILVGESLRREAFLLPTLLN